MARTFRRPRPQQPISELNVTNLIDLGFTLLIIFMIATPLIQQEQTIPVKLPVESVSKQTEPDKDTRFVSITIDKDGSYFIDNRAMSLAALGRELDTIASAPDADNVVIRVRGDDTVAYGKVIAVIDELKQRKIARISFDTQTKGK